MVHLSSPNVGRMPIWQHGDGEEATVATLAAAVRTHVKEVIAANIDVYHAVDFKTGSNMSQLESSAHC